VPFELIRPDTHIDFTGQAKYAIALSLVILVLAAGSMLVREPAVRLGLDFTGGTELQLRFADAGAVDEARIREVLSGFELADADVIRIGETGAGEYLLRFHRESTGHQNETVDELRRAFDERLGGVEVERVEYVGPKVGADLRRNGLLSMAVASALLLVYIGFRFTPVFAPGAIVAQVHDVVVTSALLVLLNREFDLTVLGALLAILGYSINDKIVIYDRIRENMAVHTTHDFPKMVNDSLNQTLSRTILTGGTAIFASLALFLWGGPVIATFGLAMAIGIVVGTYSSLYIATPILLALQARYGKQAAASTGRPAGKGRRSGEKKGARAARV
jgi:preprotein translocase subunit SecF